MNDPLNKEPKPSANKEPSAIKEPETPKQPNPPSEWQLFLSAVMFYTRIPVAPHAEHSQDALNRSRKYFPSIGILIGVIAVISFTLANSLLANSISVLLSMIITILATGAFHEDGFADSCDGLGGGWNREQILTIMKDSRLGTYAAVGLISILALKFFTLLELSTKNSLLVFALIYICGHTLSRQIASSVVEHYTYVQDIDLSKVKPITDKQLGANDIRTSYAITLIPIGLLAFQTVWATIIAIAVCSASVVLFMRYCEKRIGGYTGDVLGASQQICEILFYLTMLSTVVKT